MNLSRLFFAGMLCLGISGSSRAQSDTLIGYHDKNLKLINDPAKAKAYSVSVRRDSLWETIFVNAEDDKRLVNCYFKDSFLTVLHGLYQNYHDDGNTVFVRGWYNNGRRIGVWKSWYTGGDLRDSVLYKDGEPVMIYQFTTVRDIRKVSMTRDLMNDVTKYYRYYEDGTPLEEYEKKGKDAEIKYFFENGVVRKHIKKRNDRITEQICYLETGEVTKNCVEPKGLSLQNLLNQLPEFPGGQGGFYSYLESNFRIPPDFNTGVNVGYTGKISFMLTEKGKAYDIRILESSHPDLDQPLRDLIQNMPHWNMKKYKRNYGPVVLPLRFNLMAFYQK